MKENLMFREKLSLKFYKTLLSHADDEKFNCNDCVTLMSMLILSQFSYRTGAS